MKLTHLGHACLLVETGARLLVDPGTLSDFAGVRDLDAVLVTHQHPDHLDGTRLAALLAANPGASLVVDADTAATVEGLPDHVVVEAGDRLRFDATTVDVFGGRHAAVYGDVPGCGNAAYLIDEGAFFHPGDSFLVPPSEVDVLAVAVDGRGSSWPRRSTTSGRSTRGWRCRCTRARPPIRPSTSGCSPRSAATGWSAASTGERRRTSRRTSTGEPR